MTIRKTFALTLAVLFPLAASAQISFYFGAGAQGSRIERTDVQAKSSFTDTFPSGAPPIQYSVSTDELAGDDLGYRAFLGIRVGKYFAVEGGYLNLGEPESNFNYTVPQYNDPPLPPNSPCVAEPVGTCIRPVTNNVLRLQNAVDGYEAYGLGILPITERVELFARVGIFAWKSKFTVTDSVAGLQPPKPPNIPAFTITPSSPIKDDGINLAAGGGVNFKMSGNFLLRVEGAWYDIKNTDTAWSAGFSLVYQVPL